MAQIIVVTKPAAASPTAMVASSSALADAVQPFGVAIEPLHPGTQDPMLSSYYQITAPDLTQAEAIVESLRSHPTVDAVYIKPSASPP